MSIPLSKKILRRSMRLLPPSTFAFNVGKIFTRTLLKPGKTVQMVTFDFGGRFNLHADLSEFASNDLYCLDRQFEASTLKLWDRLAKNSKVVFDMGAHMGMFSLMAATANPQASVFAVEICRKNLKILQQNISRFSHVQIIDKAIAPQRGTFWFQEDHISGGGFLSTETNSDEHRVREKTAQAYPVDAWPLDELVAELGLEEGIDLVKMDLEGLEYELLTGQEKFWEKYAPKNLIVEIGYPKSDPARLEKILSTMKSRGYRAERIEGLYAFPMKEKEDLANWWFTHA